MTSHATTRFLTITTLAFVLSVLPGVAGAQDAPTPEKGFFLGPVGLTPRVGWQSMYDDNVYRTSQDPVSDIMSTFSAESDYGMQVRWLGVSGSASAQWVHFAELVGERGANIGSNTRLDFMFTRVAPYATISYEDRQERQYLDINTLSRTERSGVTLGSIFRFSDRTSLDVATTRSNITFDDTDYADGVNLAQALNGTSDRYTATFLKGLTPLTHLTFGAERRLDYFETSPYRNGDETRVSAGFQSQGFIRGQVQAGVLLHKTSDPTIADFLGPFLSAATSMTLVDRVQIGVTAGRSTQPSYREGIAYYGDTSFGGSLDYAIRPSIHLQGGAVVHFTDYRESNAGLQPSAEQFGIEKETRYTSGVRFNVGQSMSIHLSGSHTKRAANVPDHRFEGMSLNAGVSHAF